MNFIIAQVKPKKPPDLFSMKWTKDPIVALEDGWQKICGSSVPFIRENLPHEKSDMLQDIQDSVRRISMFFCVFLFCLRAPIENDDLLVQ